MTVAAPPSDYRLLVPDGWFRIALDPALWERRIQAFVAERFRGVDNQPLLKQQVTEQLVGQAATAYSNGGVELYLSMMAAAGIPIAAGLVVSYAPAPPGGAHPSRNEWWNRCAKARRKWSASRPAMPCAISTRTPWVHSSPRTAPAWSPPNSSALG